MENSKRTFDVKQKAMVNKLHNMQWLKHASYSSNLGKVKIIYKHDGNNKLEDKGLSAENIKRSYMAEESKRYCSIDTYKRNLSIDTMTGNDENVWDVDVNSSNPLPNSKKLINHKNKNKKDTLMIAKNLVTAKLDAQFYSDEVQNDQSNHKISRNNVEDITQAVCSNLSNLQLDQDSQELNLVKRFDGNNNYFKSTQSCMLQISDKQRPSIGKISDESTKAIETKNKEDKKFLITSLDNKESMLGQYRKGMETPVNAIHQYPINKLEYIQHMDDAKTSRSNQIFNNHSFNTVQKNAMIANSQLSIQDTCFNAQKINTQARDDRKQMLSWESNNSKFYNIFDGASYGNQQTSINNDVTSILEPTINHSKINPNVLYKYAPNTQQRLDATFLDFTEDSISLDQTGRSCNPMMQDGFHADPNNTVQSTMRINISTLASGSDDYNNPHIRNCSMRPIIYAPAPNMQMSSTQYSVLPVFNSFPYTNYTCNFIPNMIDQSNNYNNIGSTQGQQLKYTPRMQTNNYIRSSHSDSSSCTVQARNVDNIPVKSNQHCKISPNIGPNSSRMIYNNRLRAMSFSHHSGSQEDVNFRPTTDVNQCNNTYLWQIQKHESQNMANYVQMSKYPKNQATQDFDDDELENIPPIISPKDFITINRSASKNKIN